MPSRIRLAPYSAALLDNRDACCHPSNRGNTTTAVETGWSRLPADVETFGFLSI
eukprot:m.8492 g.8492  ORF g.8492 m.8492 type:complete len:54 (+) comp9185_c0_seq2:599-760(+)